MDRDAATRLERDDYLIDVFDNAIDNADLSTIALVKADDAHITTSAFVPSWEANSKKCCLYSRNPDFFRISVFEFRISCLPFLPRLRRHPRHLIAAFERCPSSCLIKAGGV